MLYSELPAAGPSQPATPTERAADPEVNPPKKIVMDPVAGAPKKKVADSTPQASATILKIQEDRAVAPLTIPETSRGHVSTFVFLSSAWSIFLIVAAPEGSVLI